MQVQIARKMQEGELREAGIDQAPGGKWATARQPLQVSNGVRWETDRGLVPVYKRGIHRHLRHLTSSGRSLAGPQSNYSLKDKSN
jgi:hypothetical protein